MLTMIDLFVINYRWWFVGGAALLTVYSCVLGYWVNLNLDHIKFLQDRLDASEEDALVWHSSLDKMPVAGYVVVLHLVNQWDGQVYDGHGHWEESREWDEKSSWMGDCGGHVAYVDDPVLWCELPKYKEPDDGKKTT